MCRYNIAIDDALMEEVRPHIGQDTAVQSWLEELLNNALLSYAAQFEESSVSDNKKIVEQLKALENDPDGVFKLGSILKPSKYSAEELRDEYLSEKYGL
jgi:hypothetical protein